ncbi:MAG TPA: 1,4-alpha-glucan branching enzyme, partial [Candidatus Limnocylindria bacterium]
MPTPELAVPAADAERLARGEHHDPHAILGAHATAGGSVVRAFHPDASAVSVVAGGRVAPMEPLGHGLWAALIPDTAPPLEYRLRFSFPDGNDWERDDPYRFLPTLGELDLHLIGEGSHERLWEVLGAHRRTVDGTAGVAFAVWAPNARSVRVVGDFDRWDGRLFPMRSLGASGVWELFV